MTIAHVYGQTMNDWRQTVDELGEMMIVESLKEQRSDSLVIVAGILNYDTGKRDLLSDVLETHLIEILNQKGKYPLVEYSQIQSHRKEWLELFPDSSPEETSQEIASLLGADWSVTGVYWIKDEQFELQLKLYESESGRVIWQGQTESFAEKLKEPELKISQTREPEQEVELIQEILPAEMVDSEMEEASGMFPQTEPVESGASEMEGSVDTVPEDSQIETAVTPSEASTAATETEKDAGSFPEDTPADVPVSETGQIVDSIPEYLTAGTGVSDNEQVTDITSEMTRDETSVAGSEPDAETISGEGPVESAFDESAPVSEAPPRVAHSETAVTQSRQGFDPAPEKISTQATAFESGIPPGFIPLFVVSSSSRSGQLKGSEQAKEHSEAPPRVAHSETAVTQSRQGFDPAPEKISTQATAFESGIPPGFIPLFVVSSSSRSGQLKGSEQAKEHSDELAYISTDESRVSREEESIDSVEAAISERDQDQIRQMEGMVLVPEGRFLWAVRRVRKMKSQCIRCTCAVILLTRMKSQTGSLRVVIIVRGAMEVLTPRSRINPSSMLIGKMLKHIADLWTKGFPRRRSGKTVPAREVKRNIHSEMSNNSQHTHGMRTMRNGWENVMRTLWEQKNPMPGKFLICTAMSWSGPVIATWWIIIINWRITNPGICSITIFTRKMTILSNRIFPLKMKPRCVLSEVVLGEGRLARERRASFGRQNVSRLSRGFVHF